MRFKSVFYVQRIWRHCLAFGMGQFDFVLDLELFRKPAGEHFPGGLSERVAKHLLYILELEVEYFEREWPVLGRGANVSFVTLDHQIGYVSVWDGLHLLSLARDSDVVLQVHDRKDIVFWPEHFEQHDFLPRYNYDRLAGHPFKCDDSVLSEQRLYFQGQGLLGVRVLVDVQKALSLVNCEFLER